MAENPEHNAAKVEITDSKAVMLHLGRYCVFPLLNKLIKTKK